MPLVSKYIEFILGNGFSRDGDIPKILILFVALKNNSFKYDFIYLYTLKNKEENCLVSLFLRLDFPLNTCSLPSPVFELLNSVYKFKILISFLLQIVCFNYVHPSPSSSHTHLLPPTLCPIYSLIPF